MSAAWLAYGVAPVVSGAMGFIVPYLLVMALKFFGVVTEESSIDYGNKNKRADKLQATEERIPVSLQLKTSLWIALGPGAIVNGLIIFKASPYVFPALSSQPVMPGLEAFLKQFCFMQIFGDLLLYLGHRIQHENQFMWENFHKMHHSIDTPSVSSTAYIHPVDMTLQAGLPIILISIICQAHPITMLFYIFTRVGENTLNHSGKSNLKFLSTSCVIWSDV